MIPVRHWRRRVKGWRAPPNTESCCRPGPLGNPARLGEFIMIGDPTGRTGPLAMIFARTTRRYADSRYSEIRTKADAVAFYRKIVPHYAKRISALRGKNVMCYCALCPAHEKTGKPLGVECSACDQANDGPCHGDVILEEANNPAAPYRCTCPEDWQGMDHTAGCKARAGAK